ncbi:MAG TPA: deoxyribose-phosphate aldolase [Pseudogracilibacillus sp.]|nr:deoxyribose-phosphate aldolase [Pseudogracilibacillus sp.]
MLKKEIAAYIDHTLLKPESTEEDVMQLCKEAFTYQFKSVCVNANLVKPAVKYLNQTDIGVTSVIGFPLGATTTRTKVFEASEAIENGATELDMVIQIGALKAKEDKLVYEDIAQVVKTAADAALVKVIIETGLLTDEEKRRACTIAQEAGAHFVKTSTGFHGGGATVEDVRLMRDIVGEDVGVKASGGIRTYKALLDMIDAGATRIGASSSVDIINEIGK